MADGDDADTTDKKILGHYELGKVLGAGAFCKVRLATHLHSNEKVAVKIVNKDQIHNIKDLESVMREMHVLKNIVHPNIIRMHEVIEKPSRLYLVLDFASGGELADYIIGKGSLPEKEARTFFGQILSGVDFIHRQNVCHRDLKPQNILMVEQATGGLVCKVADFGLSNDMKSGELLKTCCGTPNYAAPEMTLSLKYDGIAVDIWSLGVILYTMLVGHEPFRADHTPELFKLIQQGQYTIPPSVSLDAADMIRQFMALAPIERMSIVQAWSHPWLAALNRFSELYNVGDEDDELDNLDLGAASVANGDGAGGCDVDGVAANGGDLLIGGKPFPDELLELLPHHHLPAALLESAICDDAQVIWVRCIQGMAVSTTADLQHSYT